MRTPWLSDPAAHPRKPVRLFCFPYAGGGPSVYRGWDRELPPSIEVLRVALPGREGRFGERPLRDARTAVDALAEALSGFLEPPYAFFGHSLGALLAFELTRALERRGRPGPTTLFVSGSRPPRLRRDRKQDEPIHHLPQPAFLQKLRELEGTPEEVLENAELMELFLPLLRADFEMSETYVYEPAAPLAVPILAFGGENDEHAPPSDLDAWQEETTSTFRGMRLPGGHFFLHAERRAIARAIAEALREGSRAG